MVTESTRDRAQVILIGAIVIAFVILGVVVVLNGLVHTEEVSSSSTSQSTTDLAVIEYELEQGIAGLGNETVNLGENDDLASAIEDADDEQDMRDIFDFDEPEDWKDSEIIKDDFSNDFKKSKSSSRGVVTNITAVDTSVTMEGGSNINVPANEDRNVIDSDDEFLGRVFEFKIDFTGNQELDLNIENGNGETVTVEVDGNNDEIRISNGDNCNNVDLHQAEIDFVSGELNNVEESCDLDVIDIDSSYNEIHMDNRGSSIDVDFIGIAGSNDLSSDFEIPWILEIIYSYDTENIESNRSVEIDMYSELL
ncbi:hypothetical protein D8Y22_20455 [Salinadaptatus halalkaliphilus]|uniref:Uncharacterized protein n=1 Tax=Salinadaptatus halalkaliphilus TaxID=2419781 RepID=A0A4S3TIZ7_9EURY|nr:hypothetical protein [Salinadaptatus halalkaliphilus]THE62835.1 hypothetical protein D8Y22_20455 [Salinadaptatus halalkaliphilus]